MSGRCVRWFAELGIEDVALVGGRNASLGELYRELSPLGVNVPNGFAVTADAYRDLIGEAGLWDQLTELMTDIGKGQRSDLSGRARRARELVYGAKPSAGLVDEIRSAY